MYDSLKNIWEKEERDHIPFWRIVMEEDMAEQDIPEEVSMQTMASMYGAMKESADEYDPCLKSNSGLSGTDGEKLQKYRETGQMICDGFIGDVMERAIKVAESNACMKRIVAAPTAGSCGIVPAVLLTAQEHFGFSDEEMLQSLYVAGGIGGVIAARAFIAGAQGGCQAEIGSASAMAAGALVSLKGGTGREISKACALALKNLLGLACDPVAGLVEVPCVKRNVIGAVNAVTSADLSLAGIESKIPPDEVIDAMKSIGKRMDESIRETGKGGLAATPTGISYSK
ncbi:MAG: L-serine ammonia-lyase, iron-sulfur-dependent, subunit alpha [Eubacterium sp.]|nr:L-serine ammonia-lyase, iron-sulfur-dependent, subunit alpha [Eubacterium sp.]